MRTDRPCCPAPEPAARAAILPRRQRGDGRNACGTQPEEVRRRACIGEMLRLPGLAGEGRVREPLGVSGFGIYARF